MKITNIISTHIKEIYYFLHYFSFFEIGTSFKRIFATTLLFVNISSVICSEDLNIAKENKRKTSKFKRTAKNLFLFCKRTLLVFQIEYT